MSLFGGPSGSASQPPGNTPKPPGNVPSPLNDENNRKRKMAVEDPPVKRVRYVTPRPVLKILTNNLYRYDFIESFNVLVGQWPNRELFTGVDHDLITERSGFFRAARSACWLKRNKATELVDDDPYIFTAYLNCLYLGADFLRKRHEENTEGSTPAEDGKGNILDHETLDFLIDLYILADKLLDPITANILIDELITFVSKMSWVPGATTVNFVYNSTVDGSPLRRLCQDWQLHECARDWALKDKAEWNLPLEFLQDLLVESGRLQVETPWKPIKKVFAQSTTTRAKVHYHRKVERKSKGA
jgi:hypothetical protein